MSQESVTIEQYRELQEKVASMEKELKEYRDFVNELAPLLDCLQGHDALVEGILSGKINNDLAKVIMGNKIDEDSAEADDYDVDDDCCDDSRSGRFESIDGNDDNEDVHCTYDADGNEYITSDTDIFGEPYEDWNDSNDRG